MQNELRQQLAIKVGTEGGFGATFEAADVLGLIYELTCQPEQAMHQRRPFRMSTGGVRQIPGSQIFNIGFKMAAIGSGSPGSAPRCDLPLAICGFGKGVNNGTAIIGSVKSGVRNLTPASKPTLAGTFTGTKSGKVELLIESVTTNTSITFRWVLTPSDGTAPVVSASITQDSADPEALGSGLDGITADFGNPASSTAGFRAGDRYFFVVVSDQDTSVTYKKTSSSIICADVGVYLDGTYHYFHSARGNLLYAGEIDGIGMWEFALKGVLESHGDAAIFSTGVVSDEIIPPGWKNLSVTGDIPSSSPFTSFSLDCGNVVTGRKDARSTSPRGVYSCNIVEHNVTGKINPELVTDATFDALDALMDGSVSAMTLQQGSEDGNIIVFSADRVQITNLQHGARERILTRDLDLAFTEPEYAADDDYNELSITFK